MHHHNDKDSGHKGMMWMMVFCCVILLVALFFAGSGFSSGGYLWSILIGVFVVAHIWMMVRGHGKPGRTGTEDKIDDALSKQPGAKDEHEHGSCCH